MRRRNAEATRRAILEAARTCFARGGYESAGVREIAAEAGVDAALVSRYFGGKEELFRAVLSLAARPEDMFYGDAAEFSARIAEMMVSEPHDASKLDGLHIMLRSANAPRAIEAIRQISNEQFYEPLADFLGGANQQARARLLGAVMMGVGLSRSMNPGFSLDAQGLASLREQLRVLVYAVITNGLEECAAALPKASPAGKAPGV